MRVAILNLKGGVGKTTSAIGLATAGAQTGHYTTVTVYDADTQGSASEWTTVAVDDGYDVPWNVQAVTQFHLSRMTGKSCPPDVLEIIDCPPASFDVLNLAVAAAEFVIVPVKPSTLDMGKMWSTLPNLGDTPAAVLITMAGIGTISLRNAQNALDDEKVPRFNTFIPQRVRLMGAGNTVPDKLYGYDDVLAEIEEVMGQ